LVALAQIDWSKKNPDWQNVCIVANSVVSNRQARAATKSYIKSRLGMDLTEAEERSRGPRYLVLQIEKGCWHSLQRP
jgi:DNA sulfur modification protein DndB